MRDARALDVIRPAHSGRYRVPITEAATFIPEWRYVRGGKVRHAVSRPTGAFTSAVCGVGPAWFEPDGWLGTGSQGEYERCAALPVCKRCAGIIAR